MRTDISLSGVGLREISRDVLILDIAESAPVMAHATLAQGTGIGQWITAGTRSYLEVEVTFALRCMRDRARRAEALERICGWAAGGGLLRAAYRPGRRLSVVCEKLPALGSAQAWAQEHTITFRAYAVPYWEDEREDVFTANGAQYAGTICRQGTARTAAEFTARNTGTGTAQTLSVTIGGTRMAFEGLSLAVGETLAVDHDEDGLQRIRVLAADGTARDASGCRTAESSDTLMLELPWETIALSAPQQMAWTVAHRGRYA